MPRWPPVPALTRGHAHRPQSQRCGRGPRRRTQTHAPLAWMQPATSFPSPSAPISPKPCGPGQMARCRSKNWRSRPFAPTKGVAARSSKHVISRRDSFERIDHPCLTGRRRSPAPPGRLPAISMTPLMTWLAHLCNTWGVPVHVDDLANLVISVARFRMPQPAPVGGASYPMFLGSARAWPGTGLADIQRQPRSGRRVQATRRQT
jgi:hypothetical protein